MTDRRREERARGLGDVLLYVQEPLACCLPAHLLDSSTQGFRASHHFAALSTGQEIRYRRGNRGGRARVAWNRVLPDHVETGFVLVPKADQPDPGLLHRPPHLLGHQRR
jgi:hypothetical protein